MTRKTNGSISSVLGRYAAVAGVAIGVSALAGAAHAATITVNWNGAPASGKCNLTDAIQAATTNLAVHSCAAGSSSTDTIVLAANTTYAGYGKVLHIQASGGAVVIQGPTGGTSTTIIKAPNYGYPSPNPLNANVCPYPAALFTGGTVTLKNLTLQSSVDGTTGICQYAGSLTLDTMELGDESFFFGFNRGGLWSYPNTPQLHRTLNITNSFVVHNYSFQNGGGVSAIGYVDTTITSTTFDTNTTESSGGGLAWGGADGKMGFLKVLSSDFFYNTTYSYGGGMYLAPDTTSAAATIDAINMQQNHASLTGGAIYVGSGAGLNKISLQDTSFVTDNYADGDSQQKSFNSDANTYNAVYCKTSSSIYQMIGSEWTHTPPLKGDGTCSFP